MSKKHKRLSSVTEEEWEQVNKFNRKLTEKYLEQSHLSPHTIKQYRSGARQFFRWLSIEGENEPLYELKSRDALDWQNYLTNYGLSESAVKFKRSVVSSLCGYLELYYSDKYPNFRNIFTRAIPAPVGQPVHEKEPVTKKELEILIEELTKREEFQMIAYIMFSYRSGARRAEVVQMKKELVNYPRVTDKNGVVKKYYITEKIRTKGRGKDGKIRALRFDDIARDAVVKWLEIRGDDDEPALFVRKFQDGTVIPLQAGTFNDWCSDVFSKILNTRVYPHIWRVSRASHMVVDEGKDIKAVQALLGHESSETSEGYVVRDESSDFDDAFE